MTGTTTDQVVELLRVLRLPHMRTTPPELLATAKTQRCEPAEAIRALLAAEVAGRQASSIRSRRKAAGFPTGKTFDSWNNELDRCRSDLQPISMFGAKFTSEGSDSGQRYPAGLDAKVLLDSHEP